MLNMKLISNKIMYLIHGILSKQLKCMMVEIRLGLDL